MNVTAITAEREAREARAAEIAAKLPPGHYYACSAAVVSHTTGEVVVTCPSHWDACLVMLATARP